MKYIDVLNLNMVNLLAENPEGFYVDNDIYLALSARVFGQKNLRIGQPYRVEEGATGDGDGRLVETHC